MERDSQTYAWRQNYRKRAAVPYSKVKTHLIFRD